MRGSVGSCGRALRGRLARKARSTATGSLPLAPPSEEPPPVVRRRGCRAALLRSGASRRSIVYGAKPPGTEVGSARGVQCRARPMRLNEQQVAGRRAAAHWGGRPHKGGVAGPTASRPQGRLSHAVRVLVQREGLWRPPLGGPDLYGALRFGTRSGIMRALRIRGAGAASSAPRRLAATSPREHRAPGTRSSCGRREPNEIRAALAPSSRVTPRRPLESSERGRPFHHVIPPS